MKRKELYGNILLIAIAALVAVWISFAWTATTGLTVATRSSRGRVANEDDRTRSKHLTVIVTVVAAPVALWAAMQRRNQG